MSRCETCQGALNPWAKRFCSVVCRGAALACPETERFWRYVNKSGPIAREGLSPCWLWTAAVTTSGYGVIGRMGGKGRGNVRAHRLSYCIAHGLDESMLGKQMVLHACDNRQCVNPDHLSLGDVRKNAREMVERGRNFTMPGTACRKAKLTEALVAQIRDEHARGVAGYRTLAKRYGVDRKIIQRIVRRIDWQHVA